MVITEFKAVVVDKLDYLAIARRTSCLLAVDQTL